MPSPDGAVVGILQVEMYLRRWWYGLFYPIHSCSESITLLPRHHTTIPTDVELPRRQQPRGSISTSPLTRSASSHPPFLITFDFLLLLYLTRYCSPLLMLQLYSILPIFLLSLTILITYALHHRPKA